MDHDPLDLPLVGSRRTARSIGEESNSEAESSDSEGTHALRKAVTPKRERRLVNEYEVAMMYYETTPSDRGGAILSLEPNGWKSKCRSFCSYPTLKKHIPILEWLPRYDVKSNLKDDLLAGLTVGVMLIPQGISYGLLADLPPQYGLYACLCVPVVYCLLGTCIQLQVGPFALISLLVANTVRSVVDPDDHPEEYIEAVLTCSIIIGMLLTIMGLFRMGSLVNFLAKPVISGLTTGGAFLIMTSQIGNFLGMKVQRGSFFETWVNVFKNISHVSGLSLLVGLVSLFILVGFRELKKTDFARKYHIRNAPVALLVMIFFTVLTGALQLQDRGLLILRDIPSGIPPPHVPTSFNRFGELIGPSIVIAIVGYALSMATSKTFAAKNHYEVSSNQELFALGIANFIGGFFNTYPSFSSLSRSALIHELGAKSMLHSFFSSMIIVLVLWFMTGYLYYLPYPVLSAIIFDSLKSLFEQLRDPFTLWITDKKDMIIWIVTFLSVLVLDVAYGLIVGVGVSLLALLYAVANPQFAVLGRFPKLPWIFKDLSRFPEAQSVTGVIVFRYESMLHFANGESFRKTIRNAIAERRRTPALPGEIVHSIVLDAASIGDCDSSALDAVIKLQNELSNDGIELILCNCRGRFRDILRRSKISFQEYVTLQDGVAYAEGKIVCSEGRHRSLSGTTVPVLSSSASNSVIIAVKDDGKYEGLEEPRVTRSPSQIQMQAQSPRSEEVESDASASSSSVSDNNQEKSNHSSS